MNKKTQTTAIKIDSTLSIFNAILLSTIGGQVVIVAPGFVQGLVEYMSFTSSQAGFIASSEMSGLAVATISMIWLISRVDWRQAITFLLIIVLIGNLVSMAVNDYQTFLILRFICGFGSGGLLSICYAVMGLTTKTDRNFGYMIMWALIYGAVVLFIMPTIYSWVGMKGMLCFFGLFAGSALFFVKALPHSGEDKAQIDENAVDLSWRYKGFALIAMFIYFLAQGAIWAYLFLIATSSGLGEQQIANSLTLSQFAGIAGALLTAMVGIRFGRPLPLIIGILAGIVPLLFLFGTTTALIYTLVVLIYNFGWNMTHPYLLAAMASFDPSGKMIVYAVAMQTLGLAAGPAVAAMSISNGNYANVIWLGIFLFSVSLVFILVPVLRQTRLAK